MSCQNCPGQFLCHRCKKYFCMSHIAKRAHGCYPQTLTKPLEIVPVQTCTIPPEVVLAIEHQNDLIQKLFEYCTRLGSRVDTLTDIVDHALEKMNTVLDHGSRNISVPKQPVKQSAKAVPIKKK